MSKKMINLARMYTDIITYDSNYTFGCPSPRLDTPQGNIHSVMRMCLPKAQKKNYKSLNLETKKNRYMKKNKKQLHEALAVLLTKLSSARENPLLMDNYVTKALRTVLLEFKKSGELHEAYKEQIQSNMESNNPWIGMLMKSISGDASVKESMTDEAIEGMVNSMLGE